MQFDLGKLKPSNYTVCNNDRIAPVLSGDRLADAAHESRSLSLPVAYSVFWAFRGPYRPKSQFLLVVVVRCNQGICE